MGILENLAQDKKQKLSPIENYQTVAIYKWNVYSKLANNNDHDS